MSSAAASAWLSSRLQVMAALLVAAVAFIAAGGAQGWLPLAHGAVPAGLVGLSLAYALPIVGRQPPPAARRRLGRPALHACRLPPWACHTYTHTHTCPCPQPHTKDLSRSCIEKAAAVQAAHQPSRPPPGHHPRHPSLPPAAQACSTGC
jgi:hypothetical protein